ncbi:hypothetical protein ACLX1H_011112 [Fusarium chlamydosporum]
MESQPQPQPQTRTRASAQDGPSMPTRATEHDIRALLSGPALNHLAPVPGGRWKEVSRTMNAIEVEYIVNRTRVLTTTIQLGANPALVTDQCWQHVYGYPTGMASLVDGALQEWTPPVSNVTNRAEEMESLAQMYNQVLDANSIMATGAPVHQSGASPAPLDAHLQESDHFATSILDQEQSHNQIQVPDESVVPHVGPFQNTQSINMTVNEQGDVSAFQDMINSIHATTNPFIFHGSNEDEANANLHWSSFAENT